MHNSDSKTGGEEILHGVSHKNSCPTKCIDNAHDCY